jgi:hypothetical protein
VVVGGETDVIPERVLVPDQPPDAVQFVALLEDHESADESPDVIDVGSADNDTVGAVGPLVTVTKAEADVEPARLLHVRV